MVSEKATALVLRVVDFSETSNVVTLYTREFGKISALAKGARRPKGPFDSALDLLCHCRIVFLRKSTGTLDLLTEAKLNHRFRFPPGGIGNLYAGYYMAELLAELTDEYDANAALFDLVDNTLSRLTTKESVEATVLHYELTLLRLLGHAPSLRACVHCGKQLPTENKVLFGLLDGGVLCGGCRSGKRSVVSMTPGVRATLELFASEHESDDWQTFDFKQVNRGELRGVMNQYVAHLLGKKPRLANFLGFLTR